MYSAGWPQTQEVAEDDPELLTLLLPLPECQDDRHAPPQFIPSQNMNDPGMQDQFTVKYKFQGQWAVSRAEGDSLTAWTWYWNPREGKKKN